MQFKYKIFKTKIWYGPKAVVLTTPYIHPTLIYINIYLITLKLKLFSKPVIIKF